MQTSINLADDDQLMTLMVETGLSSAFIGIETPDKNIYSAKPYYKRIRRFLLDYKRPLVRQHKIEFSYLRAFIKSIFIIGIVNRGRSEYWKFLIWTLFNRPTLFASAMTYVVYGYHFRTVYGLTKS